MNTLSSKIKEICLSAGFIKTGFAKAEILTGQKEYFLQWLADNKNAGMNWLGNNVEKRTNPSLVFGDIHSVISLAYLYDTPFEHSDINNPPKISRYAWGEKDYHKVIKKKLKEVCKEIESLAEGIKTLYYVDDGPVMEKVWAVKSGIGWMGKNTNVINSELGSFFFLSEILINAELDYDKPADDLCESCRICIDACPTGALFDEYKLDANLCISYQTIESKEEIIPSYIDTRGWIFGCDICQDVCPYNKRKFFTEDKNFYPKEKIFNKPFAFLDSLTEEEFNSTFEGTPVRRTKFKGWKKNLRKFSGN